MSQRKPEICAAPAMQSLAVLPVFFDLRGKRVLFAGSGEGAVWKLQLILSAGAEITLVTPDITSDVKEFVDQSPDRLTYQSREWTSADFHCCAMAIGAIDDHDQANAFAAAARNSGVPVNVIDKSEFCDFQFGSIVNRSPVVVSISTAGTAPALAQVIRSRIEALLPSQLGAWAEAAKTMRGRVKTLVPNGSERRRLWQSFAHTAWVEPASKAAAFFDQVTKRSAEPKGHVTLVGAGPGAGDLLTLRAVRAMQAADIILFDDLISDDILDLARREAKRMLVGKRGHRASCRQEDINTLMIDLARKGKRVVRLKSGDPMIFGRAGEEIAALDEQGISVETVPGVTAALAAASSLGVSLTHRDCAQGVTFLTAHSKKGVLPELNWKAHAEPSKTLMVYMGGKTAGMLADRLLDAGLAPTTPVVVMESISRNSEQSQATTLSDLTDMTISAEGPVLIGIGEVFANAQANALKKLGVSAA